MNISLEEFNQLCAEQATRIDAQNEEIKLMIQELQQKISEKKLAENANKRNNNRK